MRPSHVFSVFFLLAMGCETGAQTPVCLATHTGPVPATATEVCGQLQQLGCFLRNDAGMDLCPQAWSQWQRTLPAEDFRAVTHCYLSARTCAEVALCDRACGPGGTPVRTTLPMPDASITDASAD